MLMKLYSALNRDSFSFDFMAVASDAPYYYEQEIADKGGRIFKVPKRSRSLIGHYISIYKLLKDSDFDVIHFHTGNAFFCASEVFAARSAGKKHIVVYCHSTSDWRISGNKQKLSYKMLSGLARIYMSHAVSVRAACSRPAAEWMFGGCNGVSIFPLPVDCNAYKYNAEQRESFRERYGLTGRKIYAHTGRFGDEKNHAFMLEVFKIICGREDNSIMFFIGDGPLRAAVKSRARELGIYDRIIFWGNVNDVYAKLNAADVFLLPSKYEGYPTVVLEAQAAGLPCFVSDSVTDEVCVTELVSMLPLDKGAEYWAERLMSAKLTLPDDKYRYNAEVAEHYDIGSVVEGLQNMYTELTGN